MKLHLVEKDGKHFYEDDSGISLLSVTTILNVLNPYAGVRKAVLEDNADIGKQAHSIIKRLAEGDYIHEWYYLDKRIRNSVSASDRWCRQVHYKPRRAETIVANLDDVYAGTEDSDGGIPAGHIIVDWKTGGVMPHHFFQIAAYFVAHLKTFQREKLVGACLVYLDKETGRPHPYSLTPETLYDYYNGFLAIMGINNKSEKIRTEVETWKLTS